MCLLYLLGEKFETAMKYPKAVQRAHICLSLKGLLLVCLQFSFMAFLPFAENKCAQLAYFFSGRVEGAISLMMLNYVLWDFETHVTVQCAVGSSPIFADLDFLKFTFFWNGSTSPIYYVTIFAKFKGDWTITDLSGNSCFTALSVLAVPILKLKSISCFKTVYFIRTFLFSACYGLWSKKGSWYIELQLVT